MDNQNQKLNNVMSGSKRRSRLNLGIATLPNSGSFAGSNGSLGIIEMVGSLNPSEEHIGGCEQIRDLACSDVKISDCDNVAPAHPVRLFSSSSLTSQVGNNSTHVSSTNRETVPSSHSLQHSEEHRIQKNVAFRRTPHSEGNPTAGEDSLVEERNTETEATRSRRNTCPNSTTTQYGDGGNTLSEEHLPQPHNNATRRRRQHADGGTSASTPRQRNMQTPPFRDREEERNSLAEGIDVAIAITQTACEAPQNPPLAVLNSKEVSEYLGTSKLTDDNRWKMLRRSKQLLAMRTVTPDLAVRLELRRDWNLHRKVETVLDCFPSLKHSYSSLRGKKLDGAVSILSNGETARVDEIARSHSIRLDPVDSPKELYKYRQRIQKVIAWAYNNQLVPVMMTLTVYHRWHDLAPLCRVLRGAWSDLFARSKAGQARKEHIGLRGYIRRMEETFNDGDADFDETLNSGWHPHYHVILLVPRERLSELSDYEPELRKVWVELVRKHYQKEMGEDIPAAFLPSFEEHGLFFSRYKSAVHARKCGCPRARGGDLFEVKDGKYLAKIMGTDIPLYGGDSELTSWAKFSKTPFDLLKCKVTANLSDLWCEYAIATKKIPCFTFSKRLNTEVDTYFNSRSGNTAESSFALPTEDLVVNLKPEDYHWLYRHFLIGELLDKASQGYAVAKVWLKESFGIEVVEDATPPAVRVLQDESDASSTEDSSKFVSTLEKNADVCVFGRKKALSVPNAQCVESLQIVRHNLSLTNYWYLADFDSINIYPLILESQFDYKNKAPP